MTSLQIDTYVIDAENYPVSLAFTFRELIRVI